MDILELGRKPINESNPVGDDVRYEPEFEQLQQEIDKLSIASASGEGIDWNYVVKLASLILSEKSKNLQAATYLAAALVETEGVSGLLQGVTVLSDLVSTYWDTFYPPKKRMRGRINALKWWVERAESFLENYPSDNPAPAELVGKTQEALKKLDEAMAEKTDDAPVLSRLISYMDRLPLEAAEAPEQAPEPAPEKEVETPAAEQKPVPTTSKPAPPSKSAAPAPAATKASAAAPGEKPTSTREADQAIEAGLAQMQTGADFIMDKDMSQPLPYRVNRLAAWLTLDQLPLADGVQTRIPAPDSSIISGIENMIAVKNFEGAAMEAESRIRDYLFWLDLSRLSYQALDSLGGKYTTALEALASETALLIRKLPGLENLTFSDGTPFADKETKAWLKRIALVEGGDAGPAVAADAGGAAAAAQEAFSKARDLQKDKKTADALKLLETGLTQAGSGRGSVVWRVYLVRFLQENGLGRLSRPHLDVLLNQIDAFNLEGWEPDICLMALTTVYQGVEDDDDDESVKLAGSVLDRIARISPSTALGFVAK